MSPDPQTIATQPEATLDAEAGTAAEEAARPQADAARELTGAAAASAEALDSYSRTVAGVAERLSPSVANLRVLRATRRGRVPAGAGSAVVLTRDGFLITSAHVVAGRDRAGRATFVDGREIGFDVVGGIARLIRSMSAGVLPVKLWKPGTTPDGMPESRTASRSTRSLV